MSSDEPTGRLFRALGRASVRVRTWHVALVAFLVALAIYAPAPGWAYALAALAVAVVSYLVVDSVEIVQAYERRPYTVFGRYERVLGPGINLVLPVFGETRVFDVRTQTIEVPTQEAITRDNSPVRASAIVYLSVVDAEKAFLEVEDYRNATAYLAQTSLRAVVGDMELDDTLSERGEMNARVREQLGETVAAWGVDVEAVEVKAVLPSAAVVRAMEHQTAAERHRRAAILEAQGVRRSAVERAEGAKAAAVLRAEGRKRAAVLEAQGDAAARVLRATAAEAMGERALIERGFDAIERVGAGPAETYVVPQELTTLLGRRGRLLAELGGGSGGGGIGGGGGFPAKSVDLVELELADLVETPADADAVEIDVE